MQNKVAPNPFTLPSPGDNFSSLKANAAASDLQKGMEMSMKSNKNRFQQQHIQIDFEGIEAIQSNVDKNKREAEDIANMFDNRLKEVNRRGAEGGSYQTGAGLLNDYSKLDPALQKQLMEFEMDDDMGEAREDVEE